MGSNIVVSCLVVIWCIACMVRSQPSSRMLKCISRDYSFSLDFGTNLTTQLPQLATDYYNGAAVFIHEKRYVYACGGYLVPGNTNTNICRRREVTDNAGAWTVVDPLPVAVRDPAAAVIESTSQVILTGGITGSVSNGAYRFDGVGWSTLPNILQARHKHISVAWQDTVYVIAGYDSSATQLRHCEKLVNGFWVAAPSLALPKLQGTAVADGNFIYVAGQSNNLINLERLDASLSSSTWVRYTYFSLGNPFETLAYFSMFSYVLNDKYYLIYGYPGTTAELWSCNKNAITTQTLTQEGSMQRGLDPKCAGDMIPISSTSTSTSQSSSPSS